MEGEIKEILYCDIYNDLDDEKYNKLLDYITNLQEENQKLNNKTKRLNSKIKVLEHNCKQAEDSCRQHRLANKNKKRRLQRREEQINLYKTRNEEAIEYLEKNSEKVELNFVGFPDSIVNFKGSVSTLLKILKGKSDE